VPRATARLLGYRHRPWMVAERREMGWVSEESSRYGRGTTYGKRMR
jgi:hypothetical protein